MSKYKGGRVATVADAQDKPQCHAAGCPMPPSVSREGSPYVCSAHDCVNDPKRWPRVTAAIVEHSWLRDFITDLMRDLRLDPDRAWREYAVNFWVHEPAMRPAAHETRVRYLYRMHYELLYRVGARSSSPPVREAPAPLPGPRMAIGQIGAQP